jgi:hypothetical protein
VTETVDSIDDPHTEDEHEDSVTELLEQLAREVGTLVATETRLEASRRAPELRRAGRDVALAAAAALALLSAFVLANAAAVHGLATTMPDWAAPLVLGAAWVAVGAVLALALRARVKEIKAGTGTSPHAARDEAERAVRETLGRLVPAISREIALAAVPIAGGIAEGVVDAGEELLDDIDDYVEDIVDDVPGGGVVSQMWDVALIPGRLGIRVVTAFFRPGDSDGQPGED